ncbi:hypothetical protein [Catenuloplanes japonicus]|uniref:hypothetical protein n=1 Tax=Catenuloplanes japonicus TaxID=33876 RepID=UPI0012F7BA55|nr:hypothetical protein [Catenuloplanes japonicus]
MALTASRALVRQTERWFVRRGVPLMIEDYRFRRHVLPRMLPFLAFVSVTSLLWLVRRWADQDYWWWVLAGTLAVGTLVWTGLTAFGRRLPRFSRKTAGAILVCYAVMPVIVPLLEFLISRSNSSPGVGVGERISEQHTSFAGAVAAFLSIFAVLFAAAWLATTYGVVPLVRRGLRHAVHDMRNSVRIQGRALPTLLFVTLFFFFTGELWQATDRLSWSRVWAVVVLLASVTVLATATRLRDEIGRVEQELHPARLSKDCRRTPLAELPMEEIAPDGALKPVPLKPQQVGNLLLMLATRQLIQATVVGVGLFTFFLMLGWLVVLPETAEQWIGAPPRLSAATFGLPVALLRNALILAAFGSMYFAVTSMSDAEHRRQFFAPILDEVERTLAVRAVYLAVRDIVLPAPSPPHIPSQPTSAPTTPDPTTDALGSSP